jgi:hypothetical protein
MFTSILKSDEDSEDSDDEDEYLPPLPPLEQRSVASSEEDEELAALDLEVDEILDRVFNNEVLSAQRQATQAFQLHNLNEQFSFLEADLDLNVGDEHLNFMEAHEPKQFHKDLDNPLQGRARNLPQSSPDWESDPYMTFKGIDTDDPGGILSYKHFIFTPLLP